MTGLRVLSVGPGVTVQDLGWSGTLAFGLSRGGVADRYAYVQAEALLGHDPGAVVEMAGFGGRFEVAGPMRIALTGARFAASVDGQPMAWGAVHQLQAGQVLEIGAAQDGVYGLLSLGGGLKCPAVLGSHSTHRDRSSGLGQVVVQGNVLKAKPDPKPDRVGLKLPMPSVRPAQIRLVPTAQTGLFDTATCDRLVQTPFTVSQRGNRQGVALECREGFALEGGQALVSEIVQTGDIQIPGDGTPVVLLADCQTTGGYPRIASILPCDLHHVVQSPPGAVLRFTWITLEEGVTAERIHASELAKLGAACVPMIRNPADIPDLLSYQLVSGVTAG